MERIKVRPVLKLLHVVRTYQYPRQQSTYARLLKDKRVLVTGSSAGIGEQVAYQYAKMGCKVAVTSEVETALEKVATHCKELSPQKYTHPAIVGNMVDTETPGKVVQEAVSKLGGLDILVLNHVRPPEIRTFTGSRDDIAMFDYALNVNYRSYIHLTAHALPEITANKGNIVVMNSLVGRIPHPYISSYVSFKHGLRGFFNSLSNQFIKENNDVCVTQCYLGLINTKGALKVNKEGNQERVLTLLKPVCPAKTALAIVKAAANRKNNLYYPPGFVKTVFLMQRLSPQFVAAACRKFAN